MDIQEISLLAVFLTGLLGGVHCAGMCGGIVGALGMLNQKPLRIPVKVEAAPSAAPAVLSSVALYNLGRISSYTLFGAVAGGLGSAAWLMQSIMPIQQSAFMLSQVLLIVMGIYVAGYKRIGAVIEAAGAPVWRIVRPFATRRLGARGWLNSLLAGMLWGLVPCGLVYAVLSIALVSGSWQQGAWLMLVFGLGTLPNLMILGLSGQWLARFSRHRQVRLVAGLLIIAMGIWGLLHWSSMVSGVS